MDEIVNDFLVESNENLDRLDQELVKLESEPSSKELMASVFRTIHTIKGSCGFLGFPRLEKLAHTGESLLSLLRDGKVTLSAEITSALLALVDAVRHMLAAIQTTGQDGEEDYAPLIDLLASLQGKPDADSAAPVQTRLPVALPVAPPETADNAAHAEAIQNFPDPFPAAASKEAKSGATPEALPEAELPDPSRIGGVLVERGQLLPEDLALALEEQKKGQLKIGEILVARGATRPEDVLAAQQTLESRNPLAAGETIRVGLNLLDRLMNLVGELVLARNQLLQFSNNTQDAGFQAVSQRMNLIATELQGEVMKTRMQPIGNIWNKFPRTVRDLAHACGKHVRLEMEGQDTELDRTIIEAVKDPLTHLVRNSIDHGIETPEIRQHAGKDTTGILTLRAFHEGGQVNIEISDDGAGLNGKRIRQKAVERGLVSEQQALRMPDRDVYNLIFLPGFSTAEKVTNVSGRGVGLDVVKTNVEKIGGTVDVQSAPGRGTTVRVKIPLTLAIIPALIATCGGQRFAIPQVSLAELVRLEGEEKETGIELVHGAPVYRLRGRLLPLVYLDRELEIIRSGADQGIRRPDVINIVVLQAEDRQFGLIVDEITDTQEIVVKPLGKQLKGISAYSGATIMGDGRLALILDVQGLARRTKVIAEAREQTLDRGHSEEDMAEVREHHALLLAENGLEGRVAIPLAMVARLEEFPRTVVEHAGAQEVMQYRGQIIPLVRLSNIIPATSNADMLANASSIQVVIYSEGKRTVGLVVDRIVDIVEEHSSVESLAPRSGIVGSFVTQRHVTDLLDMPTIMRTAVPGAARRSGA